MNKYYCIIEVGVYKCRYECIYMNIWHYLCIYEYTIYILYLHYLGSVGLQIKRRSEQWSQFGIHVLVWLPYIEPYFLRYTEQKITVTIT